MTRWICMGAVLASALACGGAFEDQQHALDASDHAVLIEVSELQAEFPSVTFDPALQTWSKVKAMGTWELEYTYEDEDFSLTSMVFMEETPDNASWVMWGLGLAPAMMESEGVEFIEDPGLLTLGDEKSCGVIQSDGAPGGNLCIVRDGSVVMAIVLVGGYFDQPGDLDRIFGPPLAAAKGYAPQASPIPERTP